MNTLSYFSILALEQSFMDVTLSMTMPKLFLNIDIFSNETSVHKRRPVEKWEAVNDNFLFEKR